MDGQQPHQTPRPWSAATTAAWLLRHRDAPAVCLMVGAALLWCGSQWPQWAAPRIATDGLDRQDLLTVQTLGLDRWAASLPIAAWTVCMVAVAVVTGWQRWDRGALRLRTVCGLLWGLTVVAWCGWLATAASVPAAVVVDVPLSAAPSPPAPPAPVQAWVADAGRLAPAPGRWLCACHAEGERRLCQLQGPQGSWRVSLAAGEGVVDGPWRWTWLAHSADPAARRFELDAPAATAEGPPRRVALLAGEAVDTPAVQTRWIPAVAAAGGPLVVSASARGLSLWSSPALTASRAPSATVRSAGIVRLSLAPHRPTGWLWPLAWLALALAAAATWWPQRQTAQRWAVEPRLPREQRGES